MDPPASLKFLGTAGARFAVSTQSRHSGGLVFTLGGATVWVDPGPGALVRALSSRPRIDPSKVDALLVTHRHLDHVGDATAVVEAMTRGGFSKRGLLVGPKDALEDEPVVFRYAQSFVERREYLSAGSLHRISHDLELEGACAHDHGVETYGYRLRVPGFTIGHVVDSFWLDTLLSAYAGVDLLLVNTTRLVGGDRRYLHLGLDDAERLLSSVRPRLGVLTHFGMQLPAKKADEEALKISTRIGVPVVAARDGWTLDLTKLKGATARGSEVSAR